MDTVQYCTNSKQSTKLRNTGASINVYGIFGTFVIVLSNERDCPCIRRVALNAVIENLQMAGK